MSSRSAEAQGSPRCCTHGSQAAVRPANESPRKSTSFPNVAFSSPEPTMRLRLPLPNGGGSRRVAAKAIGLRPYRSGAQFGDWRADGVAVDDAPVPSCRNRPRRPWRPDGTWRSGGTWCPGGSGGSGRSSDCPAASRNEVTHDVEDHVNRPGFVEHLDRSGGRVPRISQQGRDLPWARRSRPSLSLLSAATLAVEGGEVVETPSE